MIYYTEINTPIGELLLAATEHGLCSIEFGGYSDTEHHLKHWSKRWLQKDLFVEADSRLARETEQIAEYFSGKRQSFDLNLDIYGTPFQKKVWQALIRIPFGTTCSYKDIGLDIGAAKAVRAIGGANHRNPLPIVIPCHRVIGARGDLVGYGGGLHLKKYLLELEKESIVNLMSG